MRNKIARLSQNITDILKSWSGVEAVTFLNTSDSDITDPFFFMSFDVFYSGDLPPAEYRHSQFSLTGAFESSISSLKDRFLLEEVPVRIEYKDLALIDLLFKENDYYTWISRENGTYFFYRLSNSTTLFSRSGGLEKIKSLSWDLPDEFWEIVIVGAETKLDHYLFDVKYAAAHNDPLFFRVSSAGYLRCVCSSLFAKNKRFEPAPRHMLREVTSLPRLPEHFIGRFDTFIRDDSEFNLDRRSEIAQLIARSLVLMS